MREPLLRVRVGNAPPVQFRPADSPVLIGRDVIDGVLVADPLVSREHARLLYEDGWVLEDVSSRNGTWRDGRRIHRTGIGAPTVLQLGAPSAATVLTLTVDGDAASGAPPARTSVPTGTAARIVIGRDPAVGLTLSDPMVSWHHAALTRQGDAIWVEDLGSTNRTLVNGISVERRLLSDGDRLLIGNTQLLLDGGSLTQVEGEGFVVDKATLTVRGGRRIVNGVSFAIPKPSLVAVIGPSGAGKSSLLRLVTGQLPPTSGTVTFDGSSMTSHRHAHRGQVGVVPQYTVAHPSLTAREALDYTARLRVSGDVSSSERRRIIQEVLEQLGLAEHAETVMSRLSGGQQRRVGIAMEMLTDPTMLILDEPTAGLDPSLVKQIMHVLRGLADQGRQILLVTHDLEHLDVVDRVLVLEAGGRAAYFGPPSGVFSHFGTASWAETFETLARPRVEAPASEGRVDAPSARGQQHLSVPRPSTRTILSQLGVVLLRHTRLVATDAWYLALLVGMPLALGALALAVPGHHGLGRPADPTEGEASRLLVLLVVGGAFLGIASPIRDLVGERHIYLHERDAGLSSSGYLMAKVLLFWILATLQCALLVGLVLWARPGPAHALVLGSPDLEIACAVVVTALCGVTIGLAISSRVATTEQTMPPLVLAIMGQLVMCGGLFPLDGRGLLPALSWAFPTRWTYAAAASTVDLNQWTQVDQRDDLWAHTASSWTGCMLLAGVIACVWLGVAAVGVNRKLRL